MKDINRINFTTTVKITLSNEVIEVWGVFCQVMAAILSNKKASVSGHELLYVSIVLQAVCNNVLQFGTSPHTAITAVPMNITAPLYSSGDGRETCFKRLHFSNQTNLEWRKKKNFPVAACASHCVPALSLNCISFHLLLNQKNIQKSAEK